MIEVLFWVVVLGCIVAGAIDELVGGPEARAAALVAFLPPDEESQDQRIEVRLVRDEGRDPQLSVYPSR